MKNTLPDIIDRILENAEIGPGMDILEVNCGTCIPAAAYTALGVNSVTVAADCPDVVPSCTDGLRILRGNVEEMTFDRKFDRIVVYDALPCFPYPRRLVKKLAALLKDGGRLTVAQVENREELMHVEELKKLFDKFFDVEVMISNARLFQVSGVKRDPLEHSHCGVTHSHGGLTHTHSHGEIAHDHTPAPNATPMAELLALMRYLVSHNDAHAQEVADLASELLTAGKNTAYDEIMDAVSDFDIVNAKLDSILCRLTVDEY